MVEYGFKIIATALVIFASTSALVTRSCHGSGGSGPASANVTNPAPGGATGSSAPELPRLQVTTTGIVSDAAVITVAASGDFQAAVDDANPGDTIVLQAGAVYTGSFILPKKSGTGWITIQSSAIPGALPAGVMVTPADAPAMPKLESVSGPVLSTAPGAHNYRLIGLEIRPGIASASALNRVRRWLKQAVANVPPQAQTPATGQAAQLENLVVLGSDAASLSEIPDHIIFDRCYIHGDPVVGIRRGIAMNSAYTAVINSYLSDFKRTDVDAQTIDVWNGPGPFKIENNYLEASGENLMFGGQDPRISGLVPSDIEIIGNHFSKPLAWKAGDPAYQGVQWSIKNLLELKNARRVLIKGNLLEFNWPQSQNGFSILFTVRNQDGTAPWSVVSDVTFEDNVLRHAGSGINILGYDDNNPSQQVQRILVENNLFYDIGGQWGDGTLFQLLNGAFGISFVHNTALQSGNLITADEKPTSELSLRDNIALENQYGIIGTNTGTGLPTLNAYFPGAVVRGNVVIGGPSADYPSGNYFPASISDVGFTDPSMLDYQLTSQSPYHSRADDGADIGVNYSALCAALSSGTRNLATMVPSCSTGN